MDQKNSHEDVEQTLNGISNKQTKIGAMISKVLEAASDALANDRVKPAAAVDPEMKETAGSDETVHEPAELVPRDPIADTGEVPGEIKDIKAKDKKKKKKKRKKERGKKKKEKKKKKKMKKDKARSKDD